MPVLSSSLSVHQHCCCQDALLRLGSSRTTLIIAHRLSAVRDAHRIIVMDAGQIVECGTHAELLARPDGHFARLYHMQQG